MDYIHYNRDYREFVKFAFFKKIFYGKSMIVKKKDGYYVMSEKKHKNPKGRMVHRNLGGPYPTRGEAVKRLEQVEWFKHHT